jgi:hypothetical protein
LLPKSLKYDFTWLEMGNFGFVTPDILHRIVTCNGRAVRAVTLEKTSIYAEKRIYWKRLFSVIFIMVLPYVAGTGDIN